MVACDKNSSQKYSVMKMSTGIMPIRVGICYTSDCNNEDMNLIKGKKYYLFIFLKMISKKCTKMRMESKFLMEKSRFFL